MKKQFLFIFITFSFLFSACDSGDSQQTEGNFLTINGLKQSLDNQEGVTIYYNGGGYSYNNQNGNLITVYEMLNIIDPNQVFLPNYGDANFTNELHLRFVTTGDTSVGNHTIVSPTSEVNQDDVVAFYFIEDDQSHVYAQPGQNIFIEKSDNRIFIKFSNITYGTAVMSGKFTINY